MKIDYRKLSVLLLPTFLRKPVIMSLLRVLMRPIQQLHDRHQTFRTQRMYELWHTGQICHIKEALNTEFGLTDYSTGFEIDDINAQGEWVWIYDEVNAFDDEQHMMFGTTTFVHDISAIMPPTSSFFVLVPQSIVIDETNKARICSIVNKYRLASRTFEIKTRL